MNPIKSARLLLAVLIALFVAVPTNFSQGKTRNLNEYRQGPSFNVSNKIFPESNQEKAPARQLLWELWSSHTKGFFDVTTYSIEGDPVTCRYFVEPDSNGQWRLVSECKYKGHCPYTSKKKCREFYNTIFGITYDTVERENSILILKDSASGKRHEF